MTSQRLKHTSQRRIYVPGLISLFLFFPLALFQLDRHGSFEKLHVLEVNWYSPELTRPNDLRFPPTRAYQVLALNGNGKHDDEKLDFAQVAIREMLAMNDTVNGLKIHFTDNAKYESLVRALDICNRERGLTYVPYESDLWILNLNQKPVLHGCIAYSHPICGTFMGVTSKQNDDASFPFQYHYESRFWPILLMLILLTALSFRKRNNN